MYTCSSPLVRRQVNDATEVVCQLSTTFPVLLSAETSHLQNYRHWRNTHTFVSILSSILSLILICCRCNFPVEKGSRVAVIKRLQQRSGFIRSVWIFIGGNWSKWRHRHFRLRFHAIVLPCWQDLRRVLAMSELSIWVLQLYLQSYIYRNPLPI